MGYLAKAQDHSVYQSDHLTRLHEAMQPMGLSIESPASIILNGKFHNIGTIENRRKKSGWYVGEEYRLGGHQFLLCTFGDFKQDIRVVFKSFNEKDRISKEVLSDLKQKQQ